MGVRETINRNAKLVAAAVCVLVALGLGVLLLQSRGHEESRDGSVVPKAWFTIDDGRTWFVGPGNKLAPFDHDGKPAYRCYVWTCDGGKTKFVSHLVRLNASARKKYGPQAEVEPWNLPPGAEEVKLPLTGDSGWVGQQSEQAGKIMMPRCSQGNGRPEPVRAE